MIPEGATFADVKTNLTPTTTELPALTVEGVVAAAELILQIRELYYSDFSPFSKTKWNELLEVKVGNSTEHVFSDEDPRRVAMIKHYAGDSKTGFALQGICEEVTTGAYGIEHDWSANSSNGSYELSVFLKALVAHIDASVR